MSDAQPTADQMRTVYVNVQLKTGRYEWRQVEAPFPHSLAKAGAIAAKAEDVARVLEMSYIPGGVVT